MSRYIYVQRVSERLLQSGQRQDAGMVSGWTGMSSIT